RIFWSDQMFRIFEFDRERVDLSFELLLAAIHPEDREKFNAGIKKTLANPKNAQLSYRLLMSDGRIKYINVQYVVHQDPKGQPLRLVGTSQDITDLKKAEDALGESEAKFRNLFESAGDSIFLLDNDVFIDCNPKALEMFGCTREQIIGQPPSRFSPEIQPDGKSSKEQAIANNREVLKGQPQYFEWKHRRYDGTFFDAAISLTAFLDKGKPYILAICRDITENKRVLEALHESEQKIRESHALLRIAGEKAKLGGWSINLQENRITCSDEVLAIHEMPVGYSPLLEEGISFYAPEWQAKITEVFTDCAQKGIPYDEEMQIITAGGKRVWVRTIGEAVKDDTGKIIKVHGAFQDITDRKQTEEALRESEEKYKQLFENAPAGIFRVDFKSGKFIDANDVFCDYAGCSQDEISFLGPFDLLTESSKKLFMERVGKMSRGINVPPTVELEILNKKGRRLNVQLNVKNICDSEGHVIGADVVAHDITLQKQIEDELRASESNFRNSLNDSPLGMRISTIEGETIYANRAILDIYGYNSIEELKKKTIKERYTPESYAAWQMRKEKRIQGEFGPSEYEISIVRKNGEIRHLQAFRKEIFWDGAVRFQVYYNDITERKRAEEEKRKLEERLNRVEKMEALGQLAGGVAHDLNNVLGVLAGYSELLLMEIPEGQRARSHAEKIMQSTEKGAAIVQDLLTLARRGVTASEVIDLNDVVSGFLKSPVFDNIQGSHPRVNFKVVCNEALLKIKGSPIHLEKTLMNLVLNAAESISGEGDVTIRTENRYLEKPIVGYDEVKEGDYVVLTLSDTGTGIPAENREKIFEPFYTKKPMGRSGTGLGLAIVWGTVKDHKGYIDVQTEIGRGTTFTLYFPVTREEMTSPQQKKCMEEYMGRGETVLVVDDIAGQREVASALIQKLGYRVHALSSGEEALEYLRQNQADILVLDMIMVPGIDGLETYQRALEINPKQKAVIVSGFSETDRVKDAQKMGAGAYVRKPYVMETLGMAIRNELRR
ncbi:MAG: signal transduction histidine kinase with reciever domain protein, partial [Deltaproteobacteria bacterium]|nr:signal transduction histidine kinase with reciever domain protein [Deltaproteobacteria bacterium]